MRIRSLVAILLLPLASWAIAAPFTVSADSHEVTDTKTGLIWKRCAVGMTASGGTCTGMASSFTHEAALTHVSMLSLANGVTWRLPNVKELSSIVDKERINPAADLVAFPATPVNWFWSASPVLGDRDYVWRVNFFSGVVDGNGNRGNVNYLRLVRAGQ